MQPKRQGWSAKPLKSAPHWLRHAHASHALDHGAPIHLVQATLGHSSVATTSLYLHARPGDSSARFLSTETFLHKSGGSALPSERPGVMDVMTAAPAAKGDHTEMKHFTIDAENKITAHCPLARKPARSAHRHSQPRSSLPTRSATTASGWSGFGTACLESYRLRSSRTERSPPRGFGKPFQGLGGPGARTRFRTP